MALRAEFLFRMREELRLIGFVRVVAGSALSALDGIVNELLPPECGMTHFAEFGVLLNKFEGLLALLRMRRISGLMAIVAGLRGGVDNLRLQHF